MFKTGPITRALNSSFKDEQVMSFYGIRKAESASRKKYTRLNETIHKKIQKQNVSSPILYWIDIEIWLYILGEKIDFNDAYRLGYDRVGCWCCPNNNMRAQMLPEYTCPNNQRNGASYWLILQKYLGKQTQRNMWILVAGKRDKAGRELHRQVMLSLNLQTAPLRIMRKFTI